MGLLGLLDNPQSNLPAVHIAGTNGKGSTSLMIADILTIAGYRVGRFSSPHLHVYTERFTINGEEISWSKFKSYLERVEDCIPELLKQGCDQPTEFEILTAMAFLYFKDEKVDLAVLEVGMGGIFDSTNVINPLVAVITSIDFDHTAFLGNTIEEIAMNKAGIIKPLTPVVIGEMSSSAQNVIARQARQLNASITPSAGIEITEVLPASLQGQYIDLQSKNFLFKQVFFSLLGDYQLKNLATAISAIELLMQKGYHVKDEHITQALSSFKVPGRLEVLQWNPLVIGDVAHNPQGARALAQSLQKITPGRKKILVCGMLDDKDILSALEPLGGETRAAVFTRPVGGRSNNWQEITRLWSKLYPHKKYYEVENIKAAVSKGVELLNGDEFLLITGSFYVLDDARKLFVK